MYKIVVYTYKNKIKQTIACYPFIKKEELSRKSLDLKKIYNKWNHIIEFEKMF